MIERSFVYNGRVVIAQYRPEVLAAFEKIRYSVAPRIASGNSTMSRVYLADKIVDKETGEVLKDR